MHFLIFLACFLLEQHPQRRDKDVRGHLGGGRDEPDEVGAVVVALFLQLLVQLEELALVLVAVALRAALVAHRKPAAGAPECVVHLRDYRCNFEVKCFIDVTVNIG